MGIIKWTIAICFIVLAVVVVRLVLIGKVTDVSAVPHLCKDTDGKDFYKAGDVKIYGFIEKKEAFLTDSYKDYCEDDNIVVEYYCIWEDYDYKVKTIEHTCENGCQNGACKKLRYAQENIFSIVYSTIKNIFSKG
jgi:hypothetical protein